MALSLSILKERYSFPDGGSMDDRDVFVVVIVSPKEEDPPPTNVSHMTVNHHCHCHSYYHDGWCFDLIHMFLHNLHPQKPMKHC